jgi:hypothetical protein
MELLSLQELCKGNPEEGGGPSIEALKVMKGRPWGRASLFMEAQLGKLKRALLPETLGYG